MLTHIYLPPFNSPSFRPFSVQDDTFMLLACDGFWDVMDAEEAVARGEELLEKGLTATEAAAQLGNLALRMGSSDNVTVVLVVFEREGEGGGGGGER